jgi:hypothetical protein
MTKLAPLFVFMFYVTLVFSPHISVVAFLELAPVGLQMAGLLHCGNWFYHVRQTQTIE